MADLVVPVIDSHVLTLIRLAVEEDLGEARVDQTARLAIPAELRAVGTIVARRPGTLAGTFLLRAILREYDPALMCEVMRRDGSRVRAGEAIARIEGNARGILTAERTLLNFLGRLSGVATLTAQYVDAVADIRPTPAITDTRKTTPGFRALEKFAVRCGGGVNHRIGLYDGVMLKDNHLAALRDRLRVGGEQGTLAQVTARIRAELDPQIWVWLEVDTLEQLAEALPGGGADVILLDNFTPQQMRAAVELRDAARARVLLEASGGITLDNVREAAHAGVDRIAIGALTHSAAVLDVSMEFA